MASHARLGRDRLTGKAVLLAPETAIDLNPTAAVVLELCDGNRTLGEIVADLSVRFEAPQQEIAGDIEQLLQRLADRGFVTLATGDD